MSRGVVGAGIVGLTIALLGLPAQAAEKAKEAPKAAPTTTSVDQVKQRIQSLMVQEMTVRVLGMQYQKELGNLQQMQAVFCDTYKLDVARFREGRYRYNDKEDKFIEQAPAKP